MCYNFAADSFYIMKLCSRLFVLYSRSRPKDDRSRHFDPHFEEVRGGVEPWWMARWKACAEFLLSVIELLFLSLTVEALQDTSVKTHCLQEWVGHRTQIIGKNSPSGHHRTTLSGYIFATKACIDNRKKSLFNISISPSVLTIW